MFYIDTAYVDYANGQFEVYTFADLSKVYLLYTNDINKARSFCKSNNYKMIVVESCPSER